MPINVSAFVVKSVLDSKGWSFPGTFTLVNKARETLDKETIRMCNGLRTELPNLAISVLGQRKRTDTELFSEDN